MMLRSNGPALVVASALLLGCVGDGLTHDKADDDEGGSSGASNGGSAGSLTMLGGHGGERGGTTQETDAGMAANTDATGLGGAPPPDGGPASHNGCAGMASATAQPTEPAIYTDFPFTPAEAMRRQCEAAAITKQPVIFSLSLGPTVTLDLVLLPAGKVTLGEFNQAVSGEKERLHSFTVNKPFYYTQTQLTRAQYAALMGNDPPADARSGGYKFNPSPQLPALETYPRARDVVLPALQKRLPNGWKARLALGDEFEYAARAGAKTVWWNGDSESDLANTGWYQGNAKGALKDVRKLLPNPWRIYDPVGNAWTWVCQTRDKTCGDLVYGGYLVRGGSVNESAFDNGCRTANEQISLNAQGMRFSVDLP